MIPRGELQRFARRLLKSRELALVGELGAGYSELLDGFETAQGEAAAEVPGAAILAAEYRLALEIYCQAFGVRELPVDPQEVKPVRRDRLRRGPSWRLAPTTVRRHWRRATSAEPSERTPRRPPGTRKPPSG